VLKVTTVKVKVKVNIIKVDLPRRAIPRGNPPEGSQFLIIERKS